MQQNFHNLAYPYLSPLVYPYMEISPWIRPKSMNAKWKLKWGFRHYKPFTVTLCIYEETKWKKNWKQLLGFIDVLGRRHGATQFMSSLANSSVVRLKIRDFLSSNPFFVLISSVLWNTSCEILFLLQGKLCFLYLQALRPSTNPMGLHCQETVVGSCTWAESVWSDALCIQVSRIIAQIKESSGYNDRVSARAEVGN